MRKIGIFLGGQPHSGGIFQYSQALLEGLISLPRSEYTVVAAYTNRYWKGWLETHDVQSRYIKVSIFSRIIASFWRRVNLPVRWWRRINRYIHGLSKSLHAEGCDIWFFPAQDVWTYEIDVPAVGIIHDLMHRYQKHFPEVSANGEYGRREKLYRNICEWSKNILVDSEIGIEHVVESYQVDPDKVCVLPYIMPKYISEPIPEDFNERYQLPEEYLFYPAQFWMHKNHLRILAALDLLRKRGVIVNVVFCGSKKNAYEEVVAKVNKLALQEQVYFMGYVPDQYMAGLYKRAKCFIMPSFFGPTNIPPLESIYCDCPSAVSDIFSMRAQLGNASLYFDPLSADSMAAAIESLWLDEGVREGLKKEMISFKENWNYQKYALCVRETVAEILNQ